jgi:hypothetical protein
VRFHTIVQTGELPFPLQLLTSVAEGAPSWTWNSVQASGTGLVDLKCGGACRARRSGCTSTCPPRVNRSGPSRRLERANYVVHTIDDALERCRMVEASPTHVEQPALS